MRGGRSRRCSASLGVRGGVWLDPGAGVLAQLGEQFQVVGDEASPRGDACAPCRAQLALQACDGGSGRCRCRGGDPGRGIVAGGGDGRGASVVTVHSAAGVSWHYCAAPTCAAPTRAAPTCAAIAGAAILCEALVELQQRRCYVAPVCRPPHRQLQLPLKPSVRAGVVSTCAWRGRGGLVPGSVNNACTQQHDCIDSLSCHVPGGGTRFRRPGFRSPALGAHRALAVLSFWQAP